MVRLEDHEPYDEIWYDVIYYTRKDLVILQMVWQNFAFKMVYIVTCDSKMSRMDSGKLVKYFTKPQSYKNWHTSSEFKSLSKL